MKSARDVSGFRQEFLRDFVISHVVICHWQNARPWTVEISYLSEAQTLNNSYSKALRNAFI